MFQVWKSRNFPCLLHNLCTVSLSVKTRMRQHGRLTPHATSCNFWNFHQIGKRVQSLAVNLRTLVLKAAGQVSSHTYDGSNEYCKYWTWNIQTRSTILQELRTVDSVRWNLIFSPPPPISNSLRCGLLLCGQFMWFIVFPILYILFLLLAASSAGIGFGGILVVRHGANLSLHAPEFIFCGVCLSHNISECHNLSAKHCSVSPWVHQCSKKCQKLSPNHPLQALTQVLLTKSLEHTCIRVSQSLPNHVNRWTASAHVIWSTLQAKRFIALHSKHKQKSMLYVACMGHRFLLT